MSFSYDSSALAAPLNHLRFMTQDTDASDYLLEDEEINYVMAVTTNIYRAAAKLCRAIAAKLLRETVLDAGVVKIEQQAARAREMRLLADQYDDEALRAEATFIDGSASPGAIILTETPSCPPAFTRDLHFSR